MTTQEPIEEHLAALLAVMASAGLEEQPPDVDPLARWRLTRAAALGGPLVRPRPQG
jgi:hypothetical protein